jgi:hypothetical protein
MEKTARKTGTARKGLCATCSNDALCTFQRKPGTPVMECLEFQGEGVDNGGNRTGNPPNPRREAHARSAHEPGLCPLCDRRLACTFPKQPGGVWLCEEFQ